MIKRLPKIRKESTLQEKIMLAFSFENEISKLKLSLSFNEILKNCEYRDQLAKMSKPEEASYFVNLQDDKPTTLFGLGVESLEEYGVPPFCISLRIHNMFMHNTMLD